MRHLTGCWFSADVLVVKRQTQDATPLEPLQRDSPKKACHHVWYTPREFNIAPENRPSQKESSLPTIIFQGYVQFRGCTSIAPAYC